MTRRQRIFCAALLAAVVAAAGGGFLLATAEPLIAKVEPPQRSAFTRREIAKGAGLAALGNCKVCHTAPGQPDYAGNRPIPTPFGTVYSTNITPSLGTGIGHWSEAAFRRALRRGISRRGRHLYPAFPYEHYTRLTDEDVRALYAFMMTRPAVETVQTPNALPFPLDQRWLMRLWNLLFFRPARFRPDPGQSAEWNRGAYLVEGIGHCGDCHTPRNLLGAERNHYALAGGECDGWTAPALGAASPAPAPWDARELLHYLRYGWDAEHGAAAGPMRPVVQSLAQADPSDLRAIALYLAAQEGAASPQPRWAEAAANKRAKASVPKPAPGEELGAALFAGACAECHVGGPAMLPPNGIDLGLSSAVSADDADNAIHLVLDGLNPGGERAGPFMPGFRNAMSDAQIAALLAYVRAHYSEGGPWRDLETTVGDLRRAGAAS